MYCEATTYNFKNNISDGPACTIATKDLLYVAALLSRKSHVTFR